MYIYYFIKVGFLSNVMGVDDETTVKLKKKENQFFHNTEMIFKAQNSSWP